MPTQPDFESVNDDGSAVARRIKDAKKAYAVFKRLKDNAELQAWNRAKIKGLVEGNAPYDKNELKRLGQSWRCNVNFREAEGVIAANAGAYWELLVEQDELIQVDYDRKYIRQPSEDYGDIIAQEYTRTMRSWPGFYFQMLLHTIEFLEYGFGPLYWPNEHDWRFKAVQSASVLTPTKASIFIDENKLILLRDTMEPSELYGIIKRGEQAEEDGWKLDEIKKAMVKVYKGGQMLSKTDAYQTSQWESLQQELTNNDLAMDETDFSDIPVVHFLVREMSGKITHYILLENDETDEYLFEAPERFNSMDQAFNFFVFDVGDGLLRSVKGLGHRIYPHIELSNRFLCSTFDGAMVSASILLQPTQGEAKKDGRLMRIGPVTIVPEGFSAIQTSFAPRLDQLTGSHTLLQRLLNNNTGVFRPHGEDFGDVEKTARQVVSEETKEARFEKNQVTFYYVQWKRFHEETFRRLVNPDYPPDAPGYDESREFMKRCADRGVPRELMNCDNVDISPSVAIGLGSPVMKLRVTDELVGASPLFDERGKINATRDWLAARVGYSKVDRYKPIQDRDTIPTSEHSLATLENNDLSEGKPVPVGVDQPHVIHAMIHFRPMVELVDLFKNNPQGINVMATQLYLSVAVPHVAVHIGYMGDNPTTRAEAAQFSELLEQVIAVQKAIEKSAQQIAKSKAMRDAQAIQTMQQAQQQAGDSDLRVKLAKVEADMKVDILKQQNQAKVREMRTAHDIALKTARTEADIARKDREAAAK